MKINVNKLVLMVCIFCMSTVFGNSEYYGDIVDNPSFTKNR